MLGANRQKHTEGIVVGEATVDQRVKVIAGLDAGSTETRVILADKKDCDVFMENEDISKELELLKSVYIIPSTYATIEDEREVLPASAVLSDNYDSNIILLQNGAEKPLLSKHRVVRGRKISDASGLVPRYMDSSTNKTDNIIFYTNIIDALGYSIMQKYNGAIPKEVDVSLVLSVRPQELTTGCRAKLADNLVGNFMFIWKSVKISINIVDLDLTTEPEAEITGTSTVCDLRAAAGIDVEENSHLADCLSESECFIHIEGGGSSIGVEVLKNGNIIDSCSRTFPLGGNYLSMVFTSRIRETMDRSITKDAADKAVTTALLRDGRNTIDVSDIVAACKNRVGMDIVERLRHEVIDQNASITLNDVEFISLSGRLFRPDEAGNTITEYVKGYVQQVSPKTDVFALPDNFIPQGNLVIGLNGGAGKWIGLGDNSADVVDDQQ